MNKFSTKVGSLSSLEPHRNYTIDITLANGVVITRRKMARTEYEAIDRVFNEMAQGDGPYQYDRTKYKIRKPIFSL